MAIDALCAGAALRVMMMSRNIEFRWQMALRAEPIALRAERRQTVRLMAIGTGDAGMIHAALGERNHIRGTLLSMGSGEEEKN